MVTNELSSAGNIGSSRRRFRFVALMAAAAILGSFFVIGQAETASAVSRTFLVNSLSPIGDDANLGDGICATSTGVCTLRAALQQANAIGNTDTITIAPAADVDADTPGVQTSGTIVGHATSTAYWMYNGVLTPWGDGGAYFMATAPVTIDFQNRLGIASFNDAYGSTAIYINGPGVTLRNFSNVKSNETAIVVGPNGDGAVIENGSSIDPGSIDLERFLWLANGADQVTVRNVSMGSTYAGGGSAIRVATGATINNLTLDRIRMYDPDTERYTGFQAEGAATLNNLTIVGSTFEGFGGANYVLDLRSFTMTNAQIVGNTFKRNSLAAGYTMIYLNTPGLGATNVIARNTFDNAGANAGTTYYAIYAVLGRTAAQQSGWRIEDNYFNGFTSNSIYLTGTGILTAQRNTFGTASYGGINAAAETGAIAMLNNAASTANSQIATWYPTATTYDPLQCTLAVTVTPPSTGSQPTVPVSVDVYFLPTGSTSGATIYLGRQTLSAAGNVTVPYTLGTGLIRVQTIDSTGRSSQYSRTITQSQVDQCGPRVTVDQAASQADPTSVRDIQFTANFSEPLATAGAGALTASDFSTAGSTALGVSVTAVTKVTDTQYTVTARANGSGTIVLALPAGAVTDALGNASVDSTSTDNSVTYASPLTIAPTAVGVVEGGVTASYTVTNSLAATDPITITPAVGTPEWATVSPSPAEIPTTATTAQFTVTAVDDNIINGTRLTSISNTVTSADPNFDGLVLTPVNLTVLDNDQPVAAQSTLAVTGGNVAADGVATHTATVTVRNATGGVVAGAQVVVSVAPGALPLSTTCTTAANGTCSVPITSTTPGTYSVAATLGGTAIQGSPQSVTFVAGPPTAANSTISAGVNTLEADGSSTTTVTVQLRDALGHPLTVSGGTVVIATTAGSIGATTDNGNGTYTATLTAPTVVSVATLDFTLAGTLGGHTATVTFVPGVASPARSTITAASPSLTADGTSTTAVTVRLLDGFDNPLTASGGTVVISTSAGTISGTTDNGDGTYTATLTSSTTAGTAQLSFTLNGSEASSTAQVVFVAGPIDLTRSTLIADPTSITADGFSTSAISVVLKDAHGNVIADSAQPVLISSDLGSLSGTTANGNGTYSATLTSTTTPGTAHLSFTVGGSTGNAQASVAFVVGGADTQTSTIEAAPTSIIANGQSTSTITVQLKDAQGNDLTTSGGAVLISSDLGALTPTTDNNDGTYTATLTSTASAGTATLNFVIGTNPADATATVDFVPGPADAGTSTISATPTSMQADGASTSSVTVQLKDAQGNNLTASGGDVSITTNLGDISGTTDNEDGTYTATLTAGTVAGNATLTFTVGGVPATESTFVALLVGTVDPTASTITAEPADLPADGVSTSQIDVQLRDSNGNALSASAGTVVITTDAGTISGTTDNGDGTYSATLTSATVAGTAAIDFTLNGVPGSTTSVAFLPGDADPTTSLISANPTSILADGATTSAVTVHLADSHGNPLTVSGGVVVITSNAGTIGGTTDNGDGTYSATLTSATTAGTATLEFTLDGVSGANTATVQFTPGTADLTNSTISAAPTSITADGASTSTVTVQLRDGNDNPLTTSGGIVVITTSTGTISATTNNGNGSYTATLTSSTTAGAATLGFSLEGTTAPGTTTVAFVPGAASTTTSEIAAAPATIIANGTSTSTITVQLKDAQGNALTSSGGTVVVSSSAGSVGTTTDHGDGTYTATLTSATLAQSATVSFTIDAAPATHSATVTFVAGGAAAGTSVISASPTSITADGASTSTILVQLKDAFGNNLTASGGIVVASTDLGSVGTTTDNGNGTYTATLTSATGAGTATVDFTLDGNPGGTNASVAFVAGAASPTTSLISAAPASITADGTSTSTITVQLADAQGNPLTAGGANVVITNLGGSISSTTDNGNGTYSATLTSSTTAGTATLGFTLAGTTGANTTQVAFVAGSASTATSEIVAVPNAITADAVSTSQITVSLRDAEGNALTSSGGTVVISTDLGSIGTTTDHGDGTYSAVLTAASTAGTATLDFSIDGTSAAATTTVRFVAGAASSGTSTITADPTSILADGSATSNITVQLKDAEGNNLTASGGTVIVTTSLGTVTPTTDNGDGTYSAVLHSVTNPGTATLSFTIGGVPAADTATVELAVGAADPDTSFISSSVLQLVADGEAQATLTVQLRDAAGNNLTTSGGTVVITTTLGDVSVTTDNGDGTYTATLTSPTTVGTATVGFTLNGGAGSNTLVITFVEGEASAATSTITATPTFITADGSETSTLTVQLIDGYGNPVTSSGGTVVISTDRGTVSSTTDNNDGTYTATLSGTVAGTAVLRFTIDGNLATAEARVQLVPGPSAVTTSSISASPTSITANGVSTSAVTVQLKDVDGNDLEVSGGTVVITTTTGTISSTTDNGNGSYTATLTSPTVVGAATLGFTIDGTEGAQTATVDFVAGPVDPTQSVISADPTQIVAGGSATSRITVQLRDAFGNDLTSSGGLVTMHTSAGTLSAVADENDGSYFADLTASTLAQTATISFTVGGLAGGETTQVVFTPGTADATQSTISANPLQIVANGTTTSAVTVVLRDENGNPLTASGGTVVISTNLGSIGGTTDNGNGTYSATLTSPTTTGTATVDFTLDGESAPATATVVFTPGAVDLTQSTITATPTEIVADGATTSAVTVQLKDVNGNNLSASAGLVVISTDAGSVGTTTDNGNGTYSATLTSGTSAGTAHLSFTVSGQDGTDTADVTFVAGGADAGTSTIEASPTQLTADGAATSTVTVHLLDANGNPLTSSDGVVVISTSLGSVGTTTDNGNGTYTATLTAGTVAGTADVTFTLDGVDGTNSASVALVAGAADATTSTIEASPTQLTADGAATSTVTVRLLDENGNPLTSSGGVVVISADLGSIGTTVNNGNGTYSATLTAGTVAGTANLTFTLGGAAGTDTAAVELLAAAADASTSTIEATPTQLTADGAAASTVTVRLLDGNGNSLTESGGTVVISTNLGSVGATTDHGDGTYSATMTAGTVAGTATVSFTLDGTSGTNSATVAFVAGSAEATTSTIEATPTQLTANGTATSAVTVRLLDANGNPLTASGGTVVIETSRGSVGTTTDNGDGTYSATLTAGTVAGTATLTFTLDGSEGADSATVALLPADADPTTSTIEASPTSLTADGTSTSTVTVHLVDVNGNALTTSDGIVVIATNLGSVGTTADHGDGSYTATLTAGTVAGTATLTFTLNGAEGTDTATVELLPAAADPTTSTIAASPDQIVADGVSTSSVTVALLDANGNALTTSGGTVVILTDLGSVGSTTDNGDGTYRATLTSAVAAGTATLSFTLDGSAGSNTAAVRFVAGGADLESSTISAAPASITADGTSTSTITVQLVDVNGNPLTTSGGVVVIATDAGTVGTTTDHGDGSYSATLTSSLAAGTATLSFTLDGVGATHETSVAFVAGEADAGQSTIAATPTSITADGVSTSTVTVNLFDANGNPLTVSGGVVVITSDDGTIGGTTDNGDGSYSAVLTSATTAGTSQLGFSLDGVTSPATATVTFVAGSASAAQSTISAFPTTLVANGVTTSAVTVQLRDANGNPITSGGPVVVVTTDIGTISGTTDNGNGTYSATLTSSTSAGTGSVGFTLGGVAGASSVPITLVAGPADAGQSTIGAAPTSITADGSSTSAITVRLLDANGNPLTASGGTVVVTTTDGSVSGTTDNGDGTYTATLTSPTTAGTATVGFTLDGATGGGTVAVAFVAGVADAGTSTIEAAPDRITANGISTSAVTVRLKDAQGNPLTASGGAVVVSSTLGTIVSTIDNGDGTYLATLRSTTFLGRATVSFTVNGVAAPATVDVVFAAGAASVTMSTISAAPTSIIADGITTSEITVQLKDALGNDLSASGGTVIVTTTAGTITPAIDNGDGTYSAILTSATTPGAATLNYSVAGQAGLTTATVNFVVGPPDLSTSVLSASELSLVVGGDVESVLTVQLKDASGNNLTSSGGTVMISADAGTVTSTTDNGDGTYTATLTAPLIAGHALVSYTLDGTPGGNTLVVTFVEGEASPAISEIAATPTTITANGSDQSVVTVTLKDGYGNPLTASGGTVAMTTSRGTLSSVTDNLDGTYSATLTGTAAGPATIRFTIDGNLGSATASVLLVPGAADPGLSRITASPTSMEANGVNSSAVTVELFDAEGNALTSSGGTVVVTTNLGTISGVTDNGNGSYTATLISPTTVGTATLGFTLDGVVGSSTTTVNFTAGRPSVETSTITAIPSMIENDGVMQSQIVVHLKDPFGNDVPLPGVTVVIGSTLGTVSGQVDHGDGTFTAILTSTQVGTAQIGFTINGVQGALTATVLVVDTTVPDAPVIAAPSDGARVSPTVQISGTGEPGATVTVMAAGAEVCSAVVTSSGTWSCGPATPLSEGPITFVALQVDPSGNVSAESGPVSVVVDGTKPSPPVLDPTNGDVVTGTAEPGAVVTVVDQGGNALCTATAGDDGRFSCTPAERVPEGVILGAYVTDEAGNRSDTTIVRVGGAHVTLEKGSLIVGETQTVHGTGFLPGENVVAVLQSTPVNLGTFVADASGDVTFTFTIPNDLDTGTHSVTLTGDRSGAVSASFEVVAAATGPGPVPPGGGGVPSTGATALAVLPVAMVALLAGTLLTLLIRRRRTPSK